MLFESTIASVIFFVFKMFINKIKINDCILNHTKALYNKQIVMTILTKIEKVTAKSNNDEGQINRIINKIRRQHAMCYLIRKNIKIMAQA